jgi:8-oxo-dGTP pyrophosphatase MutT (NUDIX family)
MKTDEITKYKVTHATPQQLKRWAHKVMTYSKKDKVDFVNAFMHVVDHDSELKKLVSKHPQVDTVHIYILSTIKSTPVLLVAHERAGPDQDKMNVLGGKVKGSKKDWKDVGTTVFEELHEELGLYPTKDTLSKACAFVHVDSYPSGTISLSVCLCVTDLGYAERDQLSHYAYLKGILPGVKWDFQEMQDFELLPLSDVETLLDLAKNRKLTNYVANHRDWLKDICSNIDTTPVVSFKTFQTKLNFLFNPKNDTTFTPVPGDGYMA